MFSTKEIKKLLLLRFVKGISNQMFSTNTYRFPSYEEIRKPLFLQIVLDIRSNVYYQYGFPPFKEIKKLLLLQLLSFVVKCSFFHPGMIFYNNLFSQYLKVCTFSQ